MTLRRIFLLSLLGGLTTALLLAAAASEIAGKWDLVFQTPVGERKATLDVTAEGAAVTAKMGDAVLKGTYQDSKLELKGNLYSAEGGYTAELRLIGKLENGQISGDAIWDTYQMSFSAKRAEQ